MVTQAITLGAILLAVCVIIYNYVQICKMPSTVPHEIIELATIIRRGADVFMLREYRVIIPVTVLLAVLFSCFIETFSGVTLLLGGCMSSATCILGMKSATYANARTTETARTTRSIGQTVKVALCGGSISGLSVHAFGLLGLITVVFCNFDGIITPFDNGRSLLLTVSCNPSIIRLTSYSLGCSLVAMFNRVAGGNYTKAADISADIVAKNRHDLPEDDSRMPNTVADFIGDNVNDIAGNCSDLLESFVATIVSSILTAVSIARAGAVNPDVLSATVCYPIALAGGGLLACIVAILYASLHKVSDNPSQELDKATTIAAGLSLVFGVISAKLIFGDLPLYSSFRLGWASPWVASSFGIISGITIGKITEYYTDSNRRPVRMLAEFAKEGTAFVITKGDAVGSRSCLAPILTIAISLILAGSLCGIYGIAIAALGMLSFVGATVSIDAFGPIADNAGGIAESCHLSPDVRVITDKLDAVGNTTAAIGKGLAIGSAAFATLSLLISYVGSYAASHEPILNAVNIYVIAGILVGGALIEYFTALLTDNTINAAYLMAEEGERQLSLPGVLEGTVKPDYAKLIGMAADEALRKMLAPSVLALLIPVIGGIFFGPEFVGGLLIGATVVAIPRAIFMGNSGGAFDNAKKLIESGGLPGVTKGSSAHKAAVAGDTVGDTRKDVVGVALDIFIKMMSTVANTMAPVFRTFHLF